VNENLFKQFIIKFIKYSLTILSLEWYFQNNWRWRCDNSKFL